MVLLRSTLLLATAVFSLAVPMQSGPDSVEMLAFGDWGGSEDASKLYKTLAEVAVSHGGEKQMDEGDIDFVLALGDNFYSHGVVDVDDKRFQETWQDVFKTSHYKTPWYVLAGNHDHNGNVSAQIAYTQKDPSKRWDFPDYYYSKTVAVGSKTLEIVFIDTILLCGANFSTIDEEFRLPLDEQSSATQWQWIEQTLSSSTADWLFVVGHYPVWSIAEHGPTGCLVEQLPALLEKYKVAAYMNGHDHNQQHLVSNGVNYFVNGAAHGVDDSTANAGKVPKDSLKFHWAKMGADTGAYSKIKFTETIMEVKYYNQHGDTIYKVNVTNPRSTE